MKKQLPIPPDQVAVLFIKHLTGTLSKSERRMLRQYTRASESNRACFKEMTDPVSLAEKVKLFSELTAH